MKQSFDKYVIYQFTDASIVEQLCKRIKAVRLSCCCSQQEFAEKVGVSIITIKRIEACKVNDITLGTLLKIMRFAGILEGIVDLIPELPESPFIINEKTGKRAQRINRKLMTV